MGTIFVDQLLMSTYAYPTTRPVDQAFAPVKPEARAASARSWVDEQAARADSDTSTWNRVPDRWTSWLACGARHG